MLTSIVVRVIDGLVPYRALFQHRRPLAEHEPGNGCKVTNSSRPQRAVHEHLCCRRFRITYRMTSCCMRERRILTWLLHGCAHSLWPTVGLIFGHDHFRQNPCLLTAHVNIPMSLQLGRFLPADVLTGCCCGGVWLRTGLTSGKVTPSRLVLEPIRPLVQWLSN
jgi:hypothetical protein